MLDSPELIRNKLQENFSRVNDRIVAASHRSGRDPVSIQVVAVTKYTPIDVVVELVSAGHVTMGENRPQQLVERASLLPDHVQWHLIGQLQRNKVRAILLHVRLIHSVDSEKLLNRINQVASELEIQTEVLLQVNVSGEESKSGFSVDSVCTQWATLSKLDYVNVTGLMTMAPHTENESMIRSTFAGLRKLRDELNSQSDDSQLTELSMGMSGDFEIAIEEGATLIRLGSVLFEGCPSLR